MTRFFLLLSMLCLAFNSNAQGEIMKSSPAELRTDNAQAVYMGSYTLEFGNWTLMFAEGEKVLAKVDIFANSAKRLARNYNFSDGSVTGGAVLVSGAEVPLADANFTVTYVSEGTKYPVYHFEGELTDVSNNTFTLDADIELLAYDYLFYTYYEMGAMDFEACVVQLQDAPDKETGVVVEMDFAGGNWEDLISDMGILKVTAETEDGRYTQLLFDAEEIESGSYVINDLYASYCYIANLTTQEYEAYFKSGTAEITVSEGNVLSLTARMKAKNDDVYILRIPLVVPAGQDWREYDGISTPVFTPNAWTQSAKTLHNGRIIVEKDGIRFDTNGVRVR